MIYSQRNTKYQLYILNIDGFIDKQHIFANKFCVAKHIILCDLILSKSMN